LPVRPISEIREIADSFHGEALAAGGARQRPCRASGPSTTPPTTARSCSASTATRSKRSDTNARLTHGAAKPARGPHGRRRGAEDPRGTLARVGVIESYAREETPPHLAGLEEAVYVSPNESVRL
jgi:hypothetical protein